MSIHIKRTKTVPAVGDLFTVLKFTFGEHAWDEELWANPLAHYRRLATGAQWKNLGEMTWPETRDYRQDRLTTIDALTREVMTGTTSEDPLPEEILRLPMERLEKILMERGLAFVSGRFCDFEGNHTDTEIYAVLRQTR